MKHNILYITIDDKKSPLGWLLAAVYLPMIMALNWVPSTQPYIGSCIVTLLTFAAVILIFRDFWHQSIQEIPVTGMQLLYKPLLAALLCKIAIVFFCDIALLYQLNYFTPTEWGPMLWDARAYAWSGTFRAQPVLTVLTLAMIMPITEEFLFRGVIFGKLYEKNSLLALIVSCLAFAAFHTIPYIAYMPDQIFPGFFFMQYLLMAIGLAWLYTGTNSIFAPILMHIIYNLALIQNMV